ncbi:hypothetical protein Tco_1373959, partial [Tanacetum coccineum]
MSENKDKYHDTVIVLEAKVKENVDMMLKIGYSIQGMFMLGPKPMSFYDSQLKHGLGYTNPYTLKKAISQNLKLYDASCLDDSKIHMNVKDTEDILKDATTSQIKMKNKMKDPIAIQKNEMELSAEQKYFPSSFISPEDPSNESLPYSSSETKPTKQQMPSTNSILVNLNEMENDFQKLFELLQTASKRESIFYTSPEEIWLNNFCQQQLKPILQELQFKLENFQKRFLRDIKEIKDVFDSTESDLISKAKIVPDTSLSAKNKVVQIVLWIVDSGCSKHMTGDHSLLKKFIEKFMGTIRFRNDNFAAITGYGDYVQGSITVCHVYYVK